jgi:hypothetical protein
MVIVLGVLPAPACGPAVADFNSKMQERTFRNPRDRIDVLPNIGRRAVGIADCGVGCVFVLAAAAVAQMSPAAIMAVRAATPNATTTQTIRRGCFVKNDILGRCPDYVAPLSCAVVNRC